MIRKGGSCVARAAHPQPVVIVPQRSEVQPAQARHAPRLGERRRQFVRWDGAGSKLNQKGEQGRTTQRRAHGD